MNVDEELAKQLLDKHAIEAIARVLQHMRDEHASAGGSAAKHAPGTAANVAVAFAKALLDAPGPPITINRTVRQAPELSRKQANITLGFYELRHALPAFAIELLGSGIIGKPELVHGRAVESDTYALSPQTPGWQGSVSPLDAAAAKPAPFAYFLLNVITSDGIAVPCGIEIITNRHWRRDSFGQRVMASAAPRQGEGEREYAHRAAAAHEAQLRFLAGRPDGWDLADEANELVGGLYDSIFLAEDALQRPGALTGLPLAGGWLHSPPSVQPALGFALLAETLTPVYELDDRGVFAVLDVCAAAGGSVDLRQLHWNLRSRSGGAPYSGADLHNALRAGEPPWVDTTDLAPPGPRDVRWYIARGVVEQDGNLRPASLLAARDLRARRIHGSVRLSLDPLATRDTLVRALRVAHADAYQLHNPHHGPLQAVREESNRIGALHVQAQKATPREPVIALALMAVGSRLAARHANPSPPARK